MVRVRFFGIATTFFWKRLRVPWPQLDGDAIKVGLEVSVSGPEMAGSIIMLQKMLEISDFLWETFGKYIGKLCECVGKLWKN